MDLHTRTDTIAELSIRIILENQTEYGSFPASPSFPQFRFGWLRDDTFVAQAALLSGYPETARNFYLWVSRTLQAHQHIIEALKEKLAVGASLNSADFLPARFTLDGHLETMDAQAEEPFFFKKWPHIYSLKNIDSKKDWPNFQTDCYGTWLWGISDYIERTGDTHLLTECMSSILMTIDYLEMTWQLPCFDPWEEYGYERSLTSAGCVCGGLMAINRLLKSDRITHMVHIIRQFIMDNLTPEGWIPKYAPCKQIDGSVLWLFTPYQVFSIDDPITKKTIAPVESSLVYDRGVKRYLNDVYYGGGKWIILTCWLGLYYVKTNQFEKARAQLNWCTEHAEANGLFPEQILEDLNYPEFKTEWEEKWWPDSPSPLLWSHSMFLILYYSLKEKEGNKS